MDESKMKLIDSHIREGLKINQNSLKSNSSTKKPQYFFSEFVSSQFSPTHYSLEASDTYRTAFVDCRAVFSLLLGTCEASRFDSISNRTSDSGFDS